jgi:hypothetical protein
MFSMSRSTKNFPQLNMCNNCVQFDEKREITPKWVMGFTSKLQGE